MKLATKIGPGESALLGFRVKQAALRSIVSSTVRARLLSFIFHRGIFEQQRPSWQWLHTYLLLGTSSWTLGPAFNTEQNMDMPDEISRPTLGWLAYRYKGPSVALHADAAKFQLQSRAMQPARPAIAWISRGFWPSAYAGFCTAHLVLYILYIDMYLQWYIHFGPRRRCAHAVDACPSTPIQPSIPPALFGFRQCCPCDCGNNWNCFFAGCWSKRVGTQVLYETQSH